MCAALGQVGLFDTCRDERVSRLLRALGHGSPDASAELIGSLGRGAGDDVSDIDLRWMPGRALTADGLCDVLSQVDSVDSLRFDPDYACSFTTRVVFVRFTGWPLFSRVDLMIEGAFGEGSLTGPWSATESAVMNVIAAIKSCRRGTDAADGLLRRGFERVGARDPGGDVVDRMDLLLIEASWQDPAVSDLAARVREAFPACRPVKAP